MRTPWITHMSVSLSVGAVLLSAPVGWAVEQSEIQTDQDTPAEAVTGAAPAANEQPTPPPFSPEGIEAANKSMQEDPRVADIDRQVKEGTLSQEDAGKQMLQLMKEHGMPVPGDMSTGAELGNAPPINQDDTEHARAPEETNNASVTDESAPSEENPDEIGTESADESSELSEPKHVPAGQSGVR